LVEILSNFSFYVYFLAVLWLSAVPLYADENQITTSASKCDSPSNRYLNLTSFYISDTHRKSRVICLKYTVILHQFVEGNGRKAVNFHRGIQQPFTGTDKRPEIIGGINMKMPVNHI